MYQISLRVSGEFPDLSQTTFLFGKIKLTIYFFKGNHLFPWGKNEKSFKNQIIGDNVKGEKEKSFFSRNRFFSKINFILKQRVDSYNFRPEIYLRFFPRKKFTNPFSMELFSNLEKIFSPKKKISKSFFRKNFLRKKLSPEKFSPKILSTHLKDFETQSSL